MHLEFHETKCFVIATNQIYEENIKYDICDQYKKIENAKQASAYCLINSICSKVLASYDIWLNYDSNHVV